MVHIKSAFIEAHNRANTLSSCRFSYSSFSPEFRSSENFHFGFVSWYATMLMHNKNMMNHWYGLLYRVSILFILKSCHQIQIFIHRTALHLACFPFQWCYIVRFATASDACDRNVFTVFFANIKHLFLFFRLKLLTTLCNSNW